MITEGIRLRRDLLDDLVVGDSLADHLAGLPSWLGRKGLMQPIKAQRAGQGGECYSLAAMSRPTRPGPVALIRVNTASVRTICATK